MNSVLADPDIKINMSLDEIIQLTRAEINQTKVRGMRNFRKSRRNKRTDGVSGRDHSVPLLSSSQGVGIYVSRKSPLLNAENKRRITEIVSNRMLNSHLIEKSKKVIPAEYKLIKTMHGVERVLVPTANYLLQQRTKLTLPRKLHKESLSSSSSSISALSEDKPPPLIAVPIHKMPVKASDDYTAMEVDTPDDDIIVLDATKPGTKQKELIDVESNLPVELLETKNPLMPGVFAMPPTRHKTLNDHFTMLTGNFSF